MTIMMLLAIISMSLAVVIVAVAYDVVSVYLHDMRLQKVLDRSYQALELARQTETTVMLTVIGVPQSERYVGKHRLVTA